MAQGIFEDQDMGQVSGGAAPTPVVRPTQSVVQTASQTGLLQGIGDLAQGLFQGAAAAQAKAIKAGQNAALSNYAQKVTALNAGVAQGTIKQADAQRQQRALYNQTIANHPEMTDDITKFNSTLMGSAGLGDTLSKGTAVDQAIQEDTKAATSAGFIQPSMTQEQQQQGLDAYRAQQHSINQMDYYSKQLQITQQKASIQAQQENIAYTRTQRANAMYDLNVKRNQQNVRGAASDFANSYLTKINGQLGDIYNQVQSGKLSPEAAQLQAKQLHDQFNQTVGQLRGAAGNDFVDGVSKPIDDTFNTWGDFISGKVDSQTANNKLQVLQTKALLPVMQDPTLAKVFATSKIMGNMADATLTSQMGTYLGKFLASGVPGSAAPTPNPTSADPEDQQQTKTWFDTLNHTVRNLQGQGAPVSQPKETYQEVVQHTNNALHAVADFSSSQKNPSQLNSALDWMASPEFSALRQMNAGLDPQAIEGVKNAIQINYNDKLIPTVQQFWRDNKTVLSTQTPAGGFPAMGAASAGATSTQADTPDAVRYVWSGNSIVFKPAPGYERNPSVAAKIQTLQQKVAPLINRQVRVAAHLDGSQDYTKYFRQEEQAYFGDPTKTPDVPAE